MHMFQRFVLPLVACAAVFGAPGAQADNKTDREKLASLVDQLKDKLEALKAKAELEKNKGKTPATPVTPAPPKTTPAPGGGSTASAPPKVLALYDAPVGTPWDKLGFSYTIMLRNLLGHFDATVDMLPVQQYTAGKVNAYDATFYMGASYDNPIPAAFLSDAVATTKTVVWFKYNLWQLSGNPAYNFTAAKGIQFNGLRGLNAVPTAAAPNPGFFDTVKYKNLDFVKYYSYDSGKNVVNADPDIGVTAVADAAKASVLVSVTNPKTAETAPYVTRSGNFWYVADMPFSFIGPRDRYLVFTDLIHDMLGVQHAENHKALVRLEDVGAMVSVQAMKTLSDYLGGKKVPFSVATIPRYVDGLGIYNGGKRQEVNLSQATNLKTALAYAQQRGGEIVMHGFTHQYGTMKNPHTGVSGDDYEFWNIVDNAPFPEDSTAWASGRLYNGLQDMRANGLNPVAWEAPHYHTSALTARAAPTLFSTTYQRVVYFTADKPNFFAAVAKDFSVGQFYPYVIRKDYYGQYVIPENLGNIEYDISTIDPTSNYNYTADMIVGNARYAMAVRDGMASYFFHPFWLEPELGVPGFEDFKKTVEGITQLGFTWVAPSTLR